MNKVSDLDRFAARLCQHIRGGTTARVDTATAPSADAGGRGPDGLDFNQLALELFHLQFEFNAAYRRQCLARGIKADQIQSWREIPAVPAAAFKEIDLTCLAPEERTTVFFSSGTTRQKTSRHFHNANSLRVYEQSLTTWFAHQFPNGYPTRVLTLTPDAHRASHSSLAHMFETLKRNLTFDVFEFAGDVQQDGTWCVNEPVAVEFLRTAERAGTPVLLLGTAFSYVHLLDHLSQQGLRFRLPAGSSLLETGGYKGRSRTLTKPELYAYITERLGLPPTGILSEYGMSELSSQAYDSVQRIYGSDEVDANVSIPQRRFCFPRWTRIQIISPETGREVLPGQTGLIRVFDLANVYSVMAIQTEDMGIAWPDEENGSSAPNAATRRLGKESSSRTALHPTGQGGFELLGRPALAEPRGCSLMTSEPSL
jgi:hypothetical protein